MRKRIIAIIIMVLLSVSVVVSPSSAALYTVKNGDTLWGISKVYNLTVDELQSLNDIDSIWIYPEQTLQLKNKEKPNQQHRIAKGDTLFSIARYYHITVAELKKWNNLKSNLIVIGDVLAVDASAAKEKPTIQSRKQPVSVAKSPTSTGKSYTMRATAYTAYCAGCSGITANGTNIRANPKLKVIAVDPRVIPLGTKVWVEGYGEAVAADTGGAIKGNKIDVFIPTEGQARQWGVKTVTVKILE
ncbi:LysM peptidoglycan-binding and 3D domain-containing protein [Lysinibacillus piscis]|uniref:Cell wall-binding protein YocH n=1 Tax=Lysinibacillus piscis TaxID=2518931 RepID=A0ABQ5NIA7_9BACI|nr:LysM peptidoglycan-binding and 3D domain-containing protein [Lysinibacillus sp. KH24]GLC88093.1 cell wall-binding protein YocH [Lysinibacillus sp. KH24]